jgi:uncharacterized RDD family membrane protein YckC
MEIHIAKNGQRMGPYPEAQVREMLASGTIAGTDLAWHEGMADWKPVSSVLGTASPAPAAGPSPIAVAPSVMPVAIIDPNLAGRGARLGAVLLDCLIAFVVVLPGLVVGVAGSEDNDTTKIIAGLLCGVGILVLAIIQIYLLTTRGQTVGKKIVGVKIVKYADSSSPGFVHACLLRAIVPAVISSVPIVGPMFSLVDICFIFSEERRCIHDLIAGTKVVNA